jgi:hypothetical protein
MNTEKINTVKQAREALNAVNISIPDYGIGSIERTKLEDASIELETIIWKIINDDIVVVSSELRISVARLKDISNDLKATNNKLNDISQRIEKVSQVVAALVDIVSIAVSAGII